MVLRFTDFGGQVRYVSEYHQTPCTCLVYHRRVDYTDYSDKTGIMVKYVTCVQCGHRWQSVKQNKNPDQPKGVVTLTAEVGHCPYCGHTLLYTKYSETLHCQNCAITWHPKKGDK